VLLGPLGILMYLVPDIGTSLNAGNALPERYQTRLCDISDLL